MIQVSASVHDGRIVSLRVSGHAGSGEYGKDLVCAAVSAVVFGLCNALDIQTGRADAEISNNRIAIKAGEDEKTQIIMRTGLIQLETIAETHHKFIQIKKTEV